MRTYVCYSTLSKSVGVLAFCINTSTTCTDILNSDRLICDEIPGGGTSLHMCSNAQTKHSERYPKRVDAKLIEFDPKKLFKSPENTLRLSYFACLFDLTMLHVYLIDF